MFSLRNLRFVLCSRDLGFFYLSYPQINDRSRGITDHYRLKTINCAILSRQLNFQVLCQTPNPELLCFF